MTLSGADIAQLLSAHGLRPSRALGQNFVADPNTVRRIAPPVGRRAGLTGARDRGGPGLLDAGPGRDGSRRGGRRDGPPPRPRPAVRRRAAPASRWSRATPWTLDLAALLAERGPGPWSLVANLPYNVATPLVLKTLVEVPTVAHLLVMVQREVGERMAAAAGEDAYGAVSVRIAYFARAEVVGRVPASVFMPRPRVDRSSSASIGGPNPRSIPPSSPTNGSMPWSGRVSPSGARCCGAPWPAWSSRPPSSGRACDPTPGPRSSTWRPGAGWRRCEQAAGPRQADGVAPGDRGASRRLPRDRRRDGHPRPGRRARGRRRRVRPHGRRRARAWEPPGFRDPARTWSSGPWPPLAVLRPSV